MQESKKWDTKSFVTFSDATSAEVFMKLPYLKFKGSPVSRVTMVQHKKSGTVRNVMLVSAATLKAKMAGQKGPKNAGDGHGCLYCGSTGLNTEKIGKWKPVVENNDRRIIEVVDAGDDGQEAGKGNSEKKGV